MRRWMRRNAERNERNPASASMMHQPASRTTWASLTRLRCGSCQANRTMTHLLGSDLAQTELASLPVIDRCPCLPACQVPGSRPLSLGQTGHTEVSQVLHIERIRHDGLLCERTALIGVASIGQDRSLHASPLQFPADMQFEAGLRLSLGATTACPHLLQLIG